MAKIGTRKTKTTTKTDKGKSPKPTPPAQPKKMVTLLAMIDDIGGRRMVVPAKDADKVIARCMQTGFKEKMAHSTRPFRVYAPNTIKYIDIEPIL